MSNNTQQPVMFNRFDEVIFKPITNEIKKYKAIIFDDSIKERNQTTHFLVFEDSSILDVIKIDKSKIIKSDKQYTQTRKDPHLSPSMQEKINYSIGLSYPSDDPKQKNNNNNKLFMKITFEDNNNNNNTVVYMQNKINSQLLGDQKINLKPVHVNPKNKSIRLYENKHNQPVKVTPKILEIEQDMAEFNKTCEDGIAKLTAAWNAEVEMEYLKQKGDFDDTIFRFGRNKSSGRVGGIKSRRKSRRK